MYMNIEYLIIANIKLGLIDDITSEKNKNLIFVYCPPKVGSTSLVSSIRLSCSHCVTILHVHDEKMLEVLCNIQNITINDIIQYNRFLGKNVTVIDIYRTPIEHKISAFFENISYHFNNTEEKINKYDVNLLIRRFNQLFPHLTNTDYYKVVYNLPYTPRFFDFNKKYIMVNMNGIKYIKLRLQDATTEWTSILRSELNLSVFIVKDYATDQKIISDVFNTFKSAYKIPENYLETFSSSSANIDNGSSSIDFYLSAAEKDKYINEWNTKKTDSFNSFTADEYILYSSISRENKINELYQQNIQTRHYIDDGCCCRRCSKKRVKILVMIRNGIALSEKDYNVHSNEIIRRLRLRQQPQPQQLRITPLIYIEPNNVVQNKSTKYVFSTKAQPREQTPLFKKGFMFK